MILLAGGLGFIGSNIAIELLKLNYDILIIDNLSNSNIKVFDILKNVNSQIKFIQADLTNKEMLYDIFRLENITAIINLAGKKAVAESIDMPNEYYNTNINIHLNLTSLAKEFNVKTYIFSSSATVYGTECVPLKETSKTGYGISNPYGWTKYMIEQMIQDLAKVSDIKFIILRYFNPVGSDLTHKLGDNPKNTPNNLMPIIIKSIAEKKDLTIFGNDYNTYDGTCIRDFIHVYDLAIGHILALKYADKMNNNIEIFNLGSGTGYSVLNMINKFKQINNVYIDVKIGKRRQGDMPIVYADITKAINLLKFKPIKTLEDMCMDSYLFYLQNKQ